MANDSRPQGYVAVVPLDYLLLQELPPAGSTVLGLYPEGASVKDLRDKIADGALTSDQVATRLRTMRLYEIVTMEHAIGGKRSVVWQITPKGAALLSQWKTTKESDNGSAPSDT